MWKWTWLGSTCTRAWLLRLAEKGAAGYGNLWKRSSALVLNRDTSFSGRPCRPATSREHALFLPHGPHVPLPVSLRLPEYPRDPILPLLSHRRQNLRRVSA